MPQLTVPQALTVALQHHKAGQLAQAEALYAQVLVQQPNNPYALHLMGLAAQQRNRHDVAVELIGQAIAIKPDMSEAHANLGNALRDLGQLDKAIAAYRQAIALKPDLAEVHNNLGNAFKDKAQLDEAIAAYRRAIALKPGLPEAESNLLYALHFHPDYDAARIGEEHHRWNQRQAERLKEFVQAWPNDPSPDRRLKVGYVSPDFRSHPVGRFLLPLLAHHDKSQVEVFAFSDVSFPDPMTQRLQSHADSWRNIAGFSDTHVAQLIRQDRIDILVDLTAHMGQNRLLVFARKPAPVQVTYLAYCSTTGLGTMDYRLSDPYLDPLGTDESCYSERTVRLPETYWCYQPEFATPEPGPPPWVDRHFITFGCLNSFRKVSEPALATWAALLRTVPNSRLLLHAHEGSHRQRVQQRLEREGIGSERVNFVGLAPMKQYLELYGQIDIALDGFPYGGGTTTCDALWMGVPVVSLIGSTAVGRGGLSILSNVGLPELSARSPEEYVRIASQLAHDPPRLSSLRSTLRQRMRQSPLMDAPRFARNVEAAYRRMWRSFVSTGLSAGGHGNR